MKKFLELLTSRTALAALIAAVASVLNIIGIDVGIGTPEQQATVLNSIAGIGGVFAMFFRMIATKKIGGGSLE